MTSCELLLLNLWHHFIKERYWFNSLFVQPLRRIVREADIMLALSYIFSLICYQYFLALANLGLWFICVYHVGCAQEKKTIYCFVRHGKPHNYEVILPKRIIYYRFYLHYQFWFRELAFFFTIQRGETLKKMAVLFQNVMLVSKYLQSWWAKGDDYWTIWKGYNLNTWYI